MRGRTEPRLIIIKTFIPGYKGGRDDYQWCQHTGNGIASGQSSGLRKVPDWSAGIFSPFGLIGGDSGLNSLNMRKIALLDGLRGLFTMSRFKWSDDLCEIIERFVVF